MEILILIALSLIAGSIIAHFDMKANANFYKAVGGPWLPPGK